MRRDLEFSKINTLRLFLDQEKKNLENLKTSNSANRNEIAQAETNILRLQEQLSQLHGEVSDRFDSIARFFSSFVSNFGDRVQNNSKIISDKFLYGSNLLTFLKC